jgi:outer membrane protein assembly factor BamA
MRRRAHLTGLCIAFLILPVFGFAQTTRSEQLRQQRQEKSETLTASERTGLEAVLYEFKERRVLERFQAGFRGFHPLLGGLATGSGFAMGTEFRKPGLLDGALNFRVSGQASLAGYQRYGLGLDAPRLANDRLFLSFNFTQRNFPQEDFFGVGPDSSEEDRSNFRLEDSDYSATVGIRPTRNFQTGVRGGVLNVNTARGTDIRIPSVEALFTSSQVPALEEQPDYRYMGAFAQYDHRDEPLNPRSGGLYRVEGDYYSDRDGGDYSFRRWQAELQQYFPFFNERRVIAFRTRLVLTDTNPGQQVPFFLMPILGGSEDLRGFREFRFRDNNSLLANLEYRWEAFSGLDLALFGDAGKVFKDAGDINLEKLKTSYGFGFRFNSSKSVFWRIDVGFSQEGTRTFVKFGHVF